MSYSPGSQLSLACRHKSFPSCELQIRMVTFKGVMNPPACVLPAWETLKEADAEQALDCQPACA